ncbi:MAG: DNA gyrase inhibitor YacG [Verrucomicrobiales bacterium]|nr:DNA gyrase inhibitor YacG [Verrucomicrobiales bacterium]
MKCPICKSPTVDAFKPFCSRYCKNIDLNRWLSERYTLKEEFSEKEIVQNFK